MSEISTLKYNGTEYKIADETARSNLAKLIQDIEDVGSLTENGVEKGTYGPSADVKGSNSTTINVPEITVDAYGRITTITNRTYTSVNTTYSNATTEVAGLMSATDKAKLDGIVIDEKISDDSENPVQSKIIHAALSEKVDKISGMGLSENDFTDTLKDKLDGIEANANNYTLPTASSTLGGVKTTSTVTSTSGLTACPIISAVPYYKDTTYSVATTSANGLMSSADKSKLNGINSNIITCSTASGTAAKTVSATNFSLFTGATVRVLFSNGNNAANPVLNVNGTGAKEIRVLRNGSKISLGSAYGNKDYGSYVWQSNTVLELYYDGTYWVILGNPIVSGSIYESGDDDTYMQRSYKTYADGYKEITISTIISGNSKTVALPIGMPFYKKLRTYGLGLAVVSGTITTNGWKVSCPDSERDKTNLEQISIVSLQHSISNSFANIKIEGYAMLLQNVSSSDK